MDSLATVCFWFDHLVLNFLDLYWNFKTPEVQNGKFHYAGIIRFLPQDMDSKRYHKITSEKYKNKNNKNRYSS